MVKVKKVIKQGRRMKEGHQGGQSRLVFMPAWKIKTSVWLELSWAVGGEKKQKKKEGKKEKKIVSLFVFCSAEQGAMNNSGTVGADGGSGDPPSSRSNHRNGQRPVDGWRFGGPA